MNFAFLKYFISISEWLYIKNRIGSLKSYYTNGAFSILLAALSFNYISSNAIGFLSGILTFSGVIIGFLINVAVLYITLGDSKVLGKMKKNKYKTPNGYKIMLGENDVTEYQFIFIYLFYTITVGLLLCIFIVSILISNYIGIYKFISNAIIINALKIGLISVLLFLLIDFCASTLKFVSKLYMLMSINLFNNKDQSDDDERRKRIRRKVDQEKLD